MRYILNKQYRLRGWYKLPTGVFDMTQRKAVFFEPSLYKLLLKCNADHDFDEAALTDKEKNFLQKLLDEGIIREAGKWDILFPEQLYKAYPARYREAVHWSVTGACNLKCRHCFMSAPHCKHGVPSHDEIMDIMDQIAECGIFRVDITGGEPLMRDDLGIIIEELSKREIVIGTLFTNGWLVDGNLLDLLEKHGMHPSFQLSFDGVGQHDFLRGVPGAEEKVSEAFRLLNERGYEITCSMCMHKGNADSLRETVRYLASTGVSSLKCGSMMDVGDWADPEVKELHLTGEEELEIFEKYIPQYFEDDAPLSIMMSGAFLYEKDSGKGWGSFYKREVKEEEENEILSCSVLKSVLYIGADGMVAPCQGMCETDAAGSFPSLKEQRLSEILKDSEYVRYSYAKVGDVRRNSECGKCEYKDRCAGGCRNSALLGEGGYYGPDPEACYFFVNGWEERIKAVAEPAYEAYIKRKQTSGEVSAKNNGGAASLPECL